MPHRTVSLLPLPLTCVLSLLAILLGLTSIPSRGPVHLTSVLASGPEPGPALSVDVALGRHPISDDIYGMNNYGVDASFARELHVPVQRWGGDATTRYNWLLDSSNAGADWYFMGGGSNPHPTPGAGADAFVRTNQADGSESLLTIPVIGWVNSIVGWNCSFPRSKYPPQQAYNPYVHPNGDDCGNGVDTSGKTLADADPSANNLQVNATWMEAWIKHLLSTFGPASKGGVQIYEMDNEPSGWGNTHRDVHPGPTGYDELINDTIPYAAMIKRDDPSAQIDGPGDFGWPAYSGMGKPGDDATAHGMGFAAYYLQRMHAYAQQHGVRLLDYFDEHYYPTTNDGVGCLALCPAGDAATQALRLASTRSLWDPTYVENNWIGKWYGAIDLIPRFQAWVNKDYPGTKVAISEYNWGGLESMNGALAEADVLGIFGREGLDLATMWGPPTSTQPGAFAFRIYRNYDGLGSRYGDTWVQSASADQGQLAIYGAQRSSDGALTLVVINKTATDLQSPLALAGFTPAGSAQVYRYSDADLGQIVRQPDQPVTAGGFSATYPAYSITMVVIPRNTGVTPTAAPFSTATMTPSRTATRMATMTPSRTATRVATATPRATATSTHTPVSATTMPGRTATSTPSRPTASATATPTRTATRIIPAATPTATATPGRTGTATSSPTATSTPTRSATATRTATYVVPSETPTQIPTPSATHTTLPAA